MITTADLRANKDLAREKAVGCICGLAIGDSLGDAARTQSNRENYGFTTDLNSGASWSTDDTEFALLTAKIIIGCRGKLTTEDVVKGWFEDVVVQDEFKRGGASEVSAAINLRRGIRPPESGKFSTFHMSDGSAMRIAPVGIICAGDPEAAATMAEIDASISHYGDGVWGAQAVAAAVSIAMVNGTMEEIIDAAMKVIPKDSWLYASMNTAFDIVEKANGSIIDVWMPLHDALRTSAWATTAEAIPAAFACLKMAHSDFKKGAILAGNFARDADTIGAVAGAILGAKYGVKEIPAHWVEKTRFPSGTCLTFTKGVDLIKIGEELADLI
ncbi:ADP-ribosylglycohydrolase family protein [Alkaliphilus peptidifermentans]|uniref:ADP-ribosylglycohydrolase n=1 Tax=Alkaliphilus peptidifermentans DSM 18978 TaxID=1120976 RepID=A0A1G5G1H2_9FIRM|nr:ADP-ribosylglycohydrolase family protein [Alkaliphilus peptidifermentans]SCY44628.1 ADP-ribosylglycohydrolase [Alkaliphilus peptidifermentans DSM 18978]